MTHSLIIFYDPAFPSRQVPLEEGPEAELARLGNVVDAFRLADALRAAAAGTPACFVNLHAPYFPKAAWTELLAFLQRGGGLISVGGAPFKRPVRREGGRWHVEAEQTAYHQALHIHEILPVNVAKVAGYASSRSIPLLAGWETRFPAADTWNLVPHVTRQSDLPHEHGSAGPMDTHTHALLKGVGADGRELTAPVVLWEHVRGTFAGARWLFVNLPLPAAFWADGGVQALQSWAEFCANGVTELWLKPGYAAYWPGEQAMLTLQAQYLGRGGEAKRKRRWSLRLSVERSTAAEDGTGRSGEAQPSSHHAVWTRRLRFDVSEQLDLIRIPLEFPVETGLYRVVGEARSDDGEVRRLEQGFWGFDERLLSEGDRIEAGRDYFMRNGRPLPVVGMTYMTSDVARKFLFLPNVAVWDRDMAHMRRAGVNWIRTGIWTAYRHVMQVDGHASEEVLRALDAFLLTAKKHGLHVTFTFFAFTPEPWEGRNPYLDPRSVEAQKRFVRSIVTRYRSATHVDWDLINEPSVFDPRRVFRDGPRSCGDPYERAAFRKWLQARHGDIETLQERWNMTPDELPDFAAADIPEPEDINFDVHDMNREKKGARWLDYVLFSMDMHNRWAKQLYDAIKDVCPDHLVTVGQDEALGAQRPSPFFYERSVDYTTVHSWWLNDDLVWDGIFSKTAWKPNLVQETGIMYVETPDGRAKRSETELRNILERKYAYAFATGAAGAIHWIWNTNYYMDNANESHIGALRADGTEKPEADVTYGFGRLMGQIGDLFRDREWEDVVVVFPYSNDFSNRRLAFDATTRLTRILSYELKVPFRAVGEYQLDALRAGRPPKLIVLPSAHNVDDGAARRLLDYVKATGTTLLWTGPAGLDAYWRPTDRLTAELGRRRLANVVREECLEIAGRRTAVSFGRRRIAELWKEVSEAPLAPTAKAAAQATAITDVPLGAGRLLWCPLPVELNDRSEPIALLYRHALSEAGYRSELEWIRGGELAGIYGRKMKFRDGALFVFVSEYAHDAEVEVHDAETGMRYAFVLEQERSVLFAADRRGRITAVYRPEEVEIRAVGG